VIYALVNPTVADEFGEVQFVNDHMHAQITHDRVDEHYVNDMCGFFFEIGIDCGNMVSVIFDEELKVDVATVAERYETFGTAHEVVCDLVAVDDQEEDKVIEIFLMRISMDNIIVEYSLNAVEQKEEKEEVEQ